MTVTILFLIFGSLLPLANRMMMQLAHQKVALHVAITKHQAATAISKGNVSGEVRLDGIVYFWEWSRPLLCVRYVFLSTTRESCNNY